ncbi:MAG: DUF3445 domain-containing protein [Acetobacteraceae bacterium]|nr:DUF3445 domain-containing protein [Acetobacteraceae bacterium]
MALQPCPLPAWIEIDAHYPAEMAGRRALLAARHAEVFAAQPGSEAMRAETLALLADHLATHHPAWFRRDGGALRNALTDERWDLAAPPLDPLEIAGRLVQEDLCLICPDPAGPVLEAAVLCAPSRWRLAEKIGRPLLAVHAPVPLYAERLGAAVDRFMGAIQPGRVALRLNWSVVDDPALFQPWGRERSAGHAAITPGNAAERLHLRVERQTFRRLTASGAVVFGIRVHSTPLARVVAVPGAAARLAAAVRALPAGMLAYKALGGVREALLSCLDGAGREG